MKGQFFVQVSCVSYSLIRKDQDTHECLKPLSKRVWCPSRGGVCAHDKLDRERSWSSGSAFRRFVAFGELVASRGGRHRELLGSHCSTSAFFPVGNCINPTGKQVCQAVAAGVWRGFSQGGEQKNNLIGFLHCCFDIRTLQGKVMVVSVACTVWVEVNSYEPCSCLNFIIGKNLAKLLYHYCFCNDKTISCYEENVKSGFNAGKRTD